MMGYIANTSTIMSNPNIKNTGRFFWFAIFLWAIAFAGSFISFQLTDPSGDSFTRGLNRVGTFLGWQLAAGVGGLVIWVGYRRRNLGAAARWAARIPPLMFLLLVSGLVALFVYGSMSRPLPDATTLAPKPATQPE